MKYIVLLNEMDKCMERAREESKLCLAICDGCVQSSQVWPAHGLRRGSCFGTPPWPPGTAGMCTAAGGWCCWGWLPAGAEVAPPSCSAGPGGRHGPAVAAPPAHTHIELYKSCIN